MHQQSQISFFYSTPFGSVMANRGYSVGAYRYGFDGKDKDNESFNGTFPVAIGIGARIYDSRLGRRWNLDPLMGDFPYESPYNFAGCSPLVFLDAEGWKKIITHVYMNYKSVKNEKTGEITLVKTGLTTVSIIANDELRSKSRVQNSAIFGRSVNNVSNEMVYDWYDVNETITHTIIDGVETGIVSETNLGDYGTITNLNLAWLADVKVDDVSIEDFFNPTGGIRWTSENGQGGETRPGSGNIVSENIDLLLAALGAASTADGTSKPTTYLEGMKTLVDAHSVGKDLAENELIIQDAIKKMEYVKQPVVDGKTKCPSCKGQEDSSHIDQKNKKGTFDILTKP